MVDYNALEQAALAEVAKHTAELEAAALYNTEKVIAAFRNNMVSDYYLKPTTGYGYSDVGRDTLDLSSSAVHMRWQLLCWATCAQAMS